MAKWNVAGGNSGAGGTGGAGVQAISASNQTFSGTVRITGGANITVGTDASGVTIQGGAGGAGGSFSGGVSNLGNTAGNTGTVSNQLVLAATNNITLSQSTDAGGATVSVSGATPFRAGLSNIGNTAGDTITALSRVVLAGGNNVTLSGSSAGNSLTVTISGPNTSAQQTGISGVAASNTTYTSGTLTITGVGGGVTVSSNTGQRVDISVAAPVAQTAQTGISGIAGSNTTYTSGSVTFTGVGGGITVSSNTGQRIDLSVAAPVAQTVQTQNVHNLSLSTTAGGATSGTMAEISSGTVTLYAGNNITLSQSATNKVVISGPNTAAQTGTQFSAGLSNIGNTAGDTVTVAGRLVLAGGNNITLSGSSNGVSETITISGGAGAGGFAGGGISGGNTAGDTGSVTGRLIFAGGANVTLSGSTNAGSETISIAGVAAQTVQTQNVHNLSISTTAGGGTSGTMAEISSGTATIYAGNNITISQSATNKLVVSALASSSLSAYTNITLSVTSDTIKFSVADPPTLAEWRNFERADGGWAVRLDAISKTPFFHEEVIPGKLPIGSVVLQLSNFSTGTLQSLDVHFGVYTFVNSTSAALLGSGSNNFNLSTASSASWSGARNWDLTSPGTVAAISNLTPGNYLFGWMFSAAATGSMAESLWAVSNTNTTAYPLGRIQPGNNQLSTATSQGAHPMFGQLSSTVNALPSNVVASDIRNQGTATLAIRPWVLLRS